MNTNYLLDTDIVIYWLKNKYPNINQKIKKINDDCIFISSITVAELYFGAYNSDRIEENTLLIDELLKEINVIAFDENGGKSFGEIKSELKREGRIICDSDLFIAATAVLNDFTLVTNNEKHFNRIGKLKSRTGPVDFFPKIFYLQTNTGPRPSFSMTSGSLRRVSMLSAASLR